jgi:branched-chain amino acid transport system ATP-binding protein
MTSPRLTCNDLSSGYGGVPVIADVNMSVSQGECVAVLGRNGVGKTTIARTIAGILGRPLMGAVVYEGSDIAAWSPDARARMGITYAPDDRGVFRQLTVEENLKLAKRRVGTLSTVTDAEEVPSVLAARWRHRAEQLSGGEQQILAIMCALAASPRILIIDELSEGLSTRAIAMVEEWLKKRVAAGLSVLLIEQRVDLALRLATRCYVMDFNGGRGTIVLAADAATLRADDSALVKLLAL